MSSFLFLTTLLTYFKTNKNATIYDSIERISMQSSIKQGLENYISYFQNLSVDTVDNLDELVVNDVRFVDHFQDVTGVEEMKYVLMKVFEDVPTPLFEINDYAIGQTNIGYIKWSFLFTGKKKEWRFRGMSEVHFTQDGKIKLHIDHWDSISQLYQKIPGVGSIIQFLKKKVSA